MIKMKTTKMECKKENTLKRCPCTYDPCDKKGKCCECLTYHLESDELPACVFPPEVERTYDRSIARFVRLKSGGKS